MVHYTANCPNSILTTVDFPWLFHVFHTMVSKELLDWAVLLWGQHIITSQVNI
jgi:hypothetical protein